MWIDLQPAWLEAVAGIASSQGDSDILTIFEYSVHAGTLISNAPTHQLKQLISVVIVQLIVRL